MALDTNKCMANIVAKIEAQKTKEKQVEFLQLHSSRMTVQQGLTLTQQLAAQQVLVARRQVRRP